MTYNAIAPGGGVPANQSSSRTSLWDSTVQTGVRIDKGFQLGNPLVASPYGQPIPFIFGKAIVPGVPVWSGQLVNQVEVTTSTLTQQIRDRNYNANNVIGTNTVTNVINSTASFALAFGKKAPGSQRANILRMWVNNVLSFDISTGASTVDNGLYSYTIYNGDESQLPDPVIVASEGPDITAFRELIYVVFKDFPLANTGGVFPEIMAEISVVSNLTNPVTPFNTSNATTPLYKMETMGIDYDNGILYLNDQNHLDLYSLNDNTLIASNTLTTQLDLYTFTLSIDKTLIYSNQNAINNQTPVNLFTPGGILVGSFGVTGGGLSSDATHLVYTDWFEPVKGTYSVDEYLTACGLFGECTVLERVGYSFTFHSYYGSLAGTTATSISTRAYTNGRNQNFDNTVMAAAPIVDVQNFSMFYFSKGTHVYRGLLCKTGFIAQTTEAARVNVGLAPANYNKFPVLYLPRVPAGGGAVRTDAWTTLVGADELTDITGSILAANETVWFQVCGPPNNPWVTFMINNDTLGKTYVRRFDTIFNKSNYTPTTDDLIYTSALSDLQLVFNIDIGAHITATDNSQVLHNATGNQRAGSPWISAVNGSIMYSINCETGQVVTLDTSLSTFVDANNPTIHYTFTLDYRDAFDPVTGAAIYPRAQGTALYPGKAQLYVLDDGALLLSTLLTQYCLAAGYTIGQIDTSGMDNTEVIGSIINTSVDLQTLLGQVCELFRVSVVESEGKIKFSRRGLGTSMTINFDITDADLAPLSQGTSKGGNDGTLVDSDRNLKDVLPNLLQVNYLDYDNLCAIGTQTAKRAQYPFSTTPIVAELDLSVPVVMTASEALYWVTNALFDMWSGATENTLRLGQKFMQAEPGDVIRLTRADGAIYVMSIDEATLNGDYSITIIARTLSAFAEFTKPADIPGIPRDVLSTAAQATLYIIDNTLLDPSQDPGDGSQISYAYDVANAATINRFNGSTYDQVDVNLSPGKVGRLMSMLPDRPLNVMWQPDDVTTFTFSLSGDTSGISSVSELDFLAGKNTVIIGDFARWEVIYFRYATINADKSVTASRLLRGRRGTDNQTMKHLPGDTALWAPFLRLIFPVAELNAIEQFKTVPLGSPDVNATYLTWKSQGGPLKPWAPVNVAAAYSSGNIVITWNRRTRLASVLHDGDGNVPLGEATESYSIDIYKANVVVRTYTATSETVTYTSADQTTDANTGLTSLHVAVYQISAVMGRGYGRNITVAITP